MRIAAIGDLHCRVNTPDLVAGVLPDVKKSADVLLITGDLTDRGLPEEARCLAKQLSALTMPILAVLGNHDHENEQEEEVAQIFTDAGIIMLDNTAYEIDNVGFAGTKGFCGGFGRNVIQPFGEKALKKFAQTGMKEAVALEIVLANLECEQKVAVLHYSPVRETLEGEPPEIFAFLGSEHLAIALDRQGVDLAVHGHAHHGAPEGRTPGGVPVHNVSRYVQEQHFGRCYKVFEIGETQTA
ncbi:MAG TPA: metallophosphoesterase [Anaerolineaceae bacterium]